MRRVTRALAIAVLVASTLATLTAGAGATAPAKKAKPAAWAATVCSSLGDWVTTIEDAAARASASPPATATKAKKALLKLVGKAVQATQSLVGDLKKAGTPAVTEGAVVASIVRQQFESVGDTLAGARATLKQVSADDPAAFVAQARTAQDAIEASLESIQGALNAASNLDVAPLVAAFNDEPACTDLTA